VIAFQVSQLMEHQDLTKAEMARQMQASHATVDWLLDPGNESAVLPRLKKRLSHLANDYRLPWFSVLRHNLLHERLAACSLTTSVPPFCA